MTFFKSKVKLITVIYLVVYFAAMSVLCIKNPPAATGEWDDYSLSLVSVLYEHNFSVSANDLAIHRKVFPSWNYGLDRYELSGFSTRGGGEMPWYAPTYSAVCIPAFLMLRLVGHNAVHAFTLTNVMLLMVALIIMNILLDVSETKKLFLTILLTANPIIFYIGWVSAEVFMYALLIVSVMLWSKNYYKCAALVLSLAGTMNLTVMVFGVLFIVDYFFEVIKTHTEGQKWFDLIKSNFLKTVLFGLCFVPCLVPPVYNYYNVGSFNLTAAHAKFTNGTEGVLQRFLAYFLDLNYGFLPYYGLLLVVALILFVLAFKKKHLRYIGIVIAFILTVMAYSLMVHINCGMSGIARYSVWAIGPVLIGVVLYFDEIADGILVKRLMTGLVAAGQIILIGIIVAYNPNKAENASYTEFSPIAKAVLDRAPALYNPLKSTFYFKTTGEEYCYVYDDYSTPQVYTTNEGYLRKVLLRGEDKQQILDKYRSASADNSAFEKLVDNIDDNLGYLNVPARYNVISAKELPIGSCICFRENGYNADDYIISGFWNMKGHEAEGTWTVGKKALLGLSTGSRVKRLKLVIDAEPYNGVQKTVISVNGSKVYDMDYTGGEIDLVIDNPGAMKPIIISLSTPNAKSPIELGINDIDWRELGIRFKEIRLEEM